MSGFYLLDKFCFECLLFITKFIMLDMLRMTSMCLREVFLNVYIFSSFFTVFVVVLLLFFIWVQTLYDCWVYGHSSEPTAFRRTFVFIGECSLMHFLPRQTPSSYVVIFFSVVLVKSLKHCLIITSLKLFTSVHIFGELELFSSSQVFKNVNRVVFSSRFQCESSEHYASCLLLLWRPLAEIMFCAWTICAMKSLCG